jgi:hypothetical protein
MKKVLIAFICVGALAALALGIAAWKIGAIVASYKPQIQQALSDAIGAEVALGDIAVALVPTTTLSVESITVRTSSGNTSGISVGSIRAHAALLPLLSKRVEISSIKINSPRITLVQDANGVSIRDVSPKRSEPRPTSNNSNSSQVASESRGFTVDIHSIEIHDGTVRFEDLPRKRSYTLDSVNLRSSVALKQGLILLSEGVLEMRALKKHKLEVKYEEVSFNQAVGSLTINASTLKTAAGDIAVSGDITSANQGAGSLQVTSSELRVAPLLSLLSDLAETQSTQQISGTTTLKIDATLEGTSVRRLSGTVGLKGIAYTQPNAPKISAINGILTVGGSPSELLLTTSALGLSVENSPLRISLSSRLTPQELTLTSCKITGFDGEMSLPSILSVEQQKLSRTTPAGRNLSIEQILRIAAPSLAATVHGTVSSFDGQFTDISFANPLQTVSGNGALVIRNGSFKGFNLANQVMSNLDGLPFISGNIRKRVPPEFEKYFASRDTIVRDLNATFTISGGALQLSNLRVLADIFLLTSQGSIGLDGQLNLRATISFDPELSNSITNRVLEMKPLLNKDGRLSIPLIVKGKTPAVAVIPDLTDIAQRAAVGTIRETLGGALRGGSGAAKGLGKGIGKVLGF